MGSACSSFSVVARSAVDKLYFVLYVLTVGNCVSCYISVDRKSCVWLAKAYSSCSGVVRSDVDKLYFVLYVLTVGNCVC